MKKIISILSFVFAAGLLSVNAQCCAEKTPACDSEKTTTVQNQTKTDVQVYYFHATRRCATCEAVESVTKEALIEYYGDKVTFTSINREDEKDNPMIEKYKVSGQTLIIIKGDKVVNLTNDAFMNARTNPDKLKAKLKSTIDSMI
ncbi:MAG: nitrophenyl compound nitroreductase subunit ArsF family protein [Bacteroidales bacterium]|nr:nitrophenyl compound nitroreductase subunit ArsF family protein [Bacteroidales bacterium]MCF8390662.1 nitrophenyl compound nitroreductase subunit ArsF family protein [Bacteroidales bacterium]